ncbi:hypothetical protein HPSD74_0280 [Glaesserella parasuis D74]|nr:hypothetical protein HPSD74_0280 [Glaesserella parasuis D74]
MSQPFNCNSLDAGYGIEEGTDLEWGLINLAPKNCNVIITY